MFATEEKIPSDIRFTYLRSKNSKRVVTIARRVDYENNIIEYGISISNPNDTFVKKIGRHISYKRLLKNPEIVFINNESVMERMLTHLMSKDQNVGENVKKAAKKKLIEFLNSYKKREEDYYPCDCENCSGHCEY